MAIANVKRKLEKSRDAVIAITRHNDSAFNPYEVLALVVGGEERLGDALPQQDHLAKMQVELADIIFCFVAADKKLGTSLQDMTRGFQTLVPASQTQRLRSAAQDGAILLVAAAIVSAASLACFDLLKARARINIASRSVRRNQRSHNATVANRKTGATAKAFLDLSDEARSDRVRVRAILSSSRSARLDRAPEAQLPTTTPAAITAPVSRAADASAASAQPQPVQVPKSIPKTSEVRRATQMNSSGGPVLPDLII